MVVCGTSTEISVFMLIDSYYKNIVSCSPIVLMCGFTVKQLQNLIVSNEINSAILLKRKRNYE